MPRSWRWRPIVPSHRVVRPTQQGEVFEGDLVVARLPLGPVFMHQKAGVTRKTEGLGFRQLIRAFRDETNMLLRIFLILAILAAWHHPAEPVETPSPDSGHHRRAETNHRNWKDPGIPGQQASEGPQGHSERNSPRPRMSGRGSHPVGPAPKFEPGSGTAAGQRSETATRQSHR